MSDKKPARKSKPKPAQLDTSTLDKAPMLDTPRKDVAPTPDISDAVMGTLSADEAKDTAGSALSPASRSTSTPSVGAPKASHDKNAAPKTQAAPQPDTAESTAPPSPDATPETGSQDTASPVPGVLSAEPPPEPPREPLRLPRGAFIALRKSGGLHFSTREVVVYPDGRIAYDVRGVPQKEYNRLRRALNDGQIISLRKQLDQANFWKSETTGKQNPDAFAYELAARIGQRSNEIELFDGSIPENFKPLLDLLTKLLPEQ